MVHDDGPCSDLTVFGTQIDACAFTQLSQAGELNLTYYGLEDILAPEFECNHDTICELFTILVFTSSPIYEAF